MAIESADIVLMKSDLVDAVTAVELSQATIRNVKQNLFWAFFYNAICIPVAAGVLAIWGGPQLSPMLGAAAMSFSSVCVVSNALRLRFFKPSIAAHSEVNPGGNLAVEVKGERKAMEKKVVIEGMMCPKCQAHVDKALNALPGVSATVSLDSKTAMVTGNVTDDAIRAAVEEAGYQVVSIT